LISVVVPCYNEEGYLPRCLRSLANQTLPKDSFEVVVVDGGNDGTGALAESFGARVIREGRRGVALARERGAEESRGEIIAITSADTEVPPDWLSRISDHFSQDPGLAAVGGPVSSYDGNWPLDLYFIFPPTHWLFYFIGLTTFSCDNVAIRRSALEKVGGFNIYLPSLEDTELAWRLRRAGRVRLDRQLVVRTSMRRAQEGWVRFALRSAGSHFKLFVLRQLPNHFPEIR
jgi:glycosyltransferase involved in cell wall biosynthesis